MSLQTGAKGTPANKSMSLSSSFNNESSLEASVSFDLIHPTRASYAVVRGSNSSWNDISRATILDATELFKIVVLHFGAYREEEACLKMLGTGMDAGGTTLSMPTVAIYCETVSKTMDGCEVSAVRASLRGSRDCCNMP